jgi:uncharacterized repeat protein (TIGR02543 family)
MIQYLYYLHNSFIVFNQTPKIFFFGGVMKKIGSIICLSLVLLFSFSLLACTPKTTVTFDTMGGSAVRKLPVETGKTLNDYSKNNRLKSIKKGYIQKGWTTDKENQNLFRFDTPIESDITLYAKWVEGFTVTFITNTPDGLPPIELEKGRTILIGMQQGILIPYRNGYRFVCWTTDIKNQNEFDLNTEITQNITLFAKWEKL